MALAVALAAGCSAAGPEPGGALEPRADLRLEPIGSGFDVPVHAAAPPGDRRLFVVEQSGRVRILRDGAVLEPPFLDLSDAVSGGSEQGLLSIAFHPDFAANGLFFANYTDRAGDTRVVRYRVSGADSNRADPASARLVLAVEQPYSNHNGGLVAFGPDGMLYVGMGDGGDAGDPHGHGQNLGSLLGKLLRLDVDGGDPYAIPRDNPFSGQAGARPEIWALGLRNPWRFAFDPPERQLYIGDVGQNRYEEIDAASSTRGGLNYGWRILEGRHCYATPRCSGEGMVAPVVEYGHSSGCSVTGGLVYRGARIPALVGHYVYADYCTGWIRSFRLAGGAATEHREWTTPRLPVSSFGVDGAGELIVVAHDGRLFRVGPR